MKECLIAVASGAYTSGYDELIGSARSRWPDSRFIAATGDWPSSTYGHLQVHEADTGRVVVIAGLLAGSQGIGLQGEVERLAEFVEWLVSQDQFPADVGASSRLDSPHASHLAG